MKYYFITLLLLIVLTGYAQQPRQDALISVIKTSDETSAKSLEAKFTANITQGKAPLAVQFTDQSTGNPTSWKWKFGDGDSSTVRHPLHTYLNPGAYTVKLTISDGINGFTLEKKDYIQVNQNYLNCDTMHYPLPQPLTYYIIPNKGYVAGNNTYGDKAVCDYFDNMHPNLVITGLICEFSLAKQVTGRNEKLYINIWKPNVASGSPGQVVATDTLLLSTAVNDVKNNKITTIDFDKPFQPGGSFFMGLTLPKLIGDSLCFWSTQAGKVPVNTSWILQSNDTWASAQALYSPQGGPAFLISDAIYPKICMLNAINETKIPIPFAVWPNPANEMITIVNQENNNDCNHYSIVNLSGVELLKGELTDSLSTNVDVSSIKPGIYLIRFWGAKSVFATRLIIK
jgi:PKD repeat protein